MRKRVTAILHANNFSDLAACTFWLQPGQPLSPYTMRTFTTSAWTNATVSFYAATIGTEQWIRLDDVVFRRTPGVPTNGTDCLEPSAPARAGAAAPVLERSEDRAWIPDGFTRRNGRARVAEPVWTATGSSAGSRTLRAAEPFDLRTAASARLRFESRLSRGVPGELQISLDGLEWRTLEWIGSSGTWQAVDIDLAGYVGQIVHIRFVLPLRTPGAESDRGGWSLRAIGVDIQSAGRRPIAVR